MCGICGELRFDRRPADLAAVQRMTDRMAPRGPDAVGLSLHDSVALGQTRLKIMDLSEASRQPVVDPELGLDIVFNGAIYNYPELRRELEACGYRFYSDHGDTEVVTKAYHRWGKHCVERFNGMFAFVVRHRDDGRTFLARDRFGIKPLYWSRAGARFRFASSLPALAAAGDLDTELDPVALHHYLTFHSVVPAPRTILRGVRKLPPATRMEISPDGEISTETWWDLRFERDAEEEARSEEDWRRCLRSELDAAVARRMLADVPVGVLLSGGLDSSLVVGLLAAAGQSGLETFSIGFETIGDEEGDEFRYSDVIAERFSTTHHKIRVSTDRILSSLDACVASMAEPMVSHDCIGFYLLSEEVSQRVKVVQSGQGADEIFAGYHWYPPLAGSASPVDDYARVFFDRDDAETRRIVRRDLPFEDDPSRAFVHDHFERSGAPDPVDKALRLDATVMLVDDPVKRVDNMTMAWGLEARVPFLDHELAELAAKIPAPLKTASGGKGILRDVARDVIPSEVIDRPKGYFPVPALKYLRGDSLRRVRETLHSRRARERGLFEPREVATLLDDPEEHLTPLRGSKLWQLALLETWLQTHEL